MDATRSFVDGRRRKGVLEWASPVLLIPGACLLAFSVTFAAVMPLRNAVMPAFGSLASLLFLPHGVPGDCGLA